jgi:hypothetical protein
MNQTAARSHRLVQFGVLCKNVFDNHGKVKNSVKKKLETYRLLLEAMKEDPFLGDVAIVELQQLDQTLEYSKNPTEENRVKMYELQFKKAMEAYHERG